jgi:hypothetical protein
LGKNPRIEKEGNREKRDGVMLTSGPHHHVVSTSSKLLFKTGGGGKMNGFKI